MADTNTKLTVHYKDWSYSSTPDSQALRGAELVVDRNEDGDLEFYLIQDALKSTFFFEMTCKDAQALLRRLNELFQGEEEET